MTKQFTAILLAVSALLCTGATLAEDHQHHHHFPADIDAFHSLLAPIWHAPQGKERSQNACAKTGDMSLQATKIQAPGAIALQNAVASLKSQCQTDPGNIDAALGKVHDAFHGVMEAKPPMARR